MVFVVPELIQIRTQHQQIPILQRDKHTITTQTPIIRGTNPTIIVINASPTTGSAGTAYSNPSYPYNNNNYYNGYNPNNNNGYNPNGYNPNNNNNGYNSYSNGNNPYSNNYNGIINGGNNNYPTSGTGSMGIDCSTVSMAQDQSACNSMQGQCSNPMVAQTCRQMCCSTQYGS
uniref:ShKT domain-containing protein n=1 Tax=Globodera pallida TaxID=36090 RepID=A0A183BS72_GLOPA